MANTGNTVNTGNGGQNGTPGQYGQYWQSGGATRTVPALPAIARYCLVVPYCPSLPVLPFCPFVVFQHQALAIPAAAVTERGQLRSVFVAAAGRAQARLVTVGARSGDRVEVLSGLSPGERIIHPAPAGLADGAKVEVGP